MPPSSYPLRRPPAWAKLETFGVWIRVFGIALIVLGIALAVLTVEREQSEYGPLFALMIGSGFVAGGLVAIGVTFSPKPQGPTLVNAVAVTPVPELLPDDWVHLFRRRRFSRFVTLGLFGLGFYLLVLVGGMVFLVAVGEEEPGLLVLLLVPFASGVYWVVFAIRQAQSRQRLGTFGRPPTGLTLGRSGLTLLEPVATHFIPWERVQSVDARLAPTRGGPSPLYPLIVLAFRPEQGASVEYATLHLIQYVAPPHAIYTAIATALEQPEFRQQLGDSQAQSTMDAWVAATQEPAA